MKTIITTSGWESGNWHTCADTQGVGFSKWPEVDSAAAINSNAVVRVG